MWQHPPRAAGPIQIKDRINNFSHVHGAVTATWLGLGNQFGDQVPLLVSQIRWVRLPCHTPVNRVNRDFSHTFLQLWEGFQAFYDEHDRNVELHDIHQKLEKLMDAPEAGFWLYFQIPIATFLGWRLMPASLVGQSVATLGDVIQLIDAEAPITAEELIRLRRSLHRIRLRRI